MLASHISKWHMRSTMRGIHFSSTLATATAVDAVGNDHPSLYDYADMLTVYASIQ
jgi:hypothetical protein